MFEKDKQKDSAGESARAAARDCVPSLISEDMRITGDVNSDGDIQVDGEIDGNVKTQMLTVGESAHIRGEIQADSVRICGSVTGKIDARLVEILKTAKVIADIVHEDLSIEVGAFVTGNLRRAEDQEAPPATGEQKMSLVQESVPNPLAAKVKDAANE